MLARSLQPVIEEALADTPAVMLVGARQTGKTTDVSGLRALADLAGKAFVLGIVLHLGAATIPFGPNLVACPVAALWETP